MLDLKRKTSSVMSEETCNVRRIFQCDGPSGDLSNIMELIEE